MYADIHRNSLYNIVLNNVVMALAIFNSLVTNYNDATQSWVEQNCLRIQNNKCN